MEQKPKRVAMNSKAMEAELTEILSRQKQNHCPKCKAPLMETEKVDGKTVYHCWCCGLIGNYEELVKQTEQIKKRMYENAPRVTCNLCGSKGVIEHELRPVTLFGEKYPQGRSMFICFKCIPEK